MLAAQIPGGCSLLHGRKGKGRREGGMEERMEEGIGWREREGWRGKDSWGLPFSPLKQNGSGHHKAGKGDS